MQWLAPADLALQQAAWWAAVLAAAHGRPLLGAAAGVVAVSAHLALRPGERPRIARAALVAAAYGCATDTALAAAGLAAFAGTAAATSVLPGSAAPSIASGLAASPLWMISLWALFGAGLTASMARLAAWPAPILAALGAVAGPLAYRAGAALGAMELLGAAAHLAIAAQWAIALPLCARAARAPELPLPAPRAEARP